MPSFLLLYVGRATCYHSDTHTHTHTQTCQINIFVFSFSEYGIYFNFNVEGLLSLTKSRERDTL
jgi:hypothetical protein